MIRSMGIFSVNTMKKIFLFSLFFCLLPSFVSAEPLILLKDINPFDDADAPFTAGVTGGGFFFGANDKVNGYELWVSDGTIENTRITKDIYPNLSNGISADTFWYASMNGRLYFVASNGPSGDELWESNGTPFGTRIVRDINPNGSSYPEMLEFFGETLLFTADDGTHGNELWSMDGNSGETQMLIDLNPNGSSYPYSFVTLNDWLFFNGDDGESGNEIWVSDLTGTNIRQLKDIHPLGGSHPIFFYEHIDDSILFVATDETNSRGLWRSDGTPEETVLIKNINPNGNGFSTYLGFEKIDGSVYFSANEGVPGDSLYKSDGTPSGTVPVFYFENKNFTSFIKRVNDTFYFVLNSHELWKSDGTTSGTKLVKDVRLTAPLAASNERYGKARPFAMKEGRDDRIYRIENAKDDNGNRVNPSLSISDLSISSMPHGYSFLKVYNDTLFFSVDDGIHGVELWTSDGTSDGTYMIEDLNQGAASSDPRKYRYMDNTLYFVANDGISGDEIWAYPLPEKNEPNPKGAASSGCFVNTLFLRYP